VSTQGMQDRLMFEEGQPIEDKNHLRTIKVNSVPLIL
jgi:hypothetical protein